MHWVQKLPNCRYLHGLACFNKIQGRTSQVTTLAPRPADRTVMTKKILKWQKKYVSKTFSDTKKIKKKFHQFANIIIISKKTNVVRVPWSYGHITTPTPYVSLRGLLSKTHRFSHLECKRLQMNVTVSSYSPPSFVSLRRIFNTNHRSPLNHTVTATFREIKVSLGL